MRLVIERGLGVVIFILLVAFVFLGVVGLYAVGLGGLRLILNMIGG